MNVRSIPSRRLKRERRERGLLCLPFFPSPGAGWVGCVSPVRLHHRPERLRGEGGAHTHTQQSSRKGTNPGSSGSVDNSVCECVSVFMSSLSPLSAYMAQKSHHNILLSSFVFHWTFFFLHFSSLWLCVGSWARHHRLFKIFFHSRLEFSENEWKKKKTTSGRKKMSKLYIGNLAAEANEAALRQLLQESGVGNVSSVLVKRGGYAFIDCPEQSTVDRAIEKLNGKFSLYSQFTSLTSIHSKVGVGEKWTKKKENRGGRHCKQEEGKKWEIIDWSSRVVATVAPRYGRIWRHFLYSDRPIYFNK